MPSHTLGWSRRLPTYVAYPEADSLVPEWEAMGLLPIPMDFLRLTFPNVWGSPPHMLYVHIYVCAYHVTKTSKKSKTREKEVIKSFYQEKITF